MRAKEYLRQAYRLDQRINSKLEQVASLRDLAEKATAVITGMPGGGSVETSPMAGAVAKIVDLQAEIGQDVERLVVLKREISAVIKSVADPEYQALLEARYLCFKTWEQIAVDMGYSVRAIYRNHDLALKKIHLAESVQ